MSDYGFFIGTAVFVLIVEFVAILKSNHDEEIAFDVENIIKQLEEERDSSYGDYENYAEKHDMDVECDDLFCRGLDRAIEIVKRGGRDD